MAIELSEDSPAQIFKLRGKTKAGTVTDSLPGPAQWMISDANLAGLEAGPDSHSTKVRVTEAGLAAGGVVTLTGRSGTLAPATQMINLKQATATSLFIEPGEIETLP